MHRKWPGYTLYELLMTLALVAIVAGLGLPSFGSMLARSTMRVEVNVAFG